jgi:tetratricopeptide (TPR) repeat protein
LAITAQLDAGTDIAQWWRLMGISDKKTALLQLPLSEQQAESLLLERLKDTKTEEDHFRWTLFLVGYYRSISKMEAATALLERFVENSNNHEQQAHCQLALGQIATDDQRLEAALSHFRAALDFHPKKKKIAYVLHNNIGYCLNMLGRYIEGEKHCRMAIEIKWKRASGYRNLGVSLQGQGHLAGAAWAFFEAIKAEVSDPRAHALLEKLVAEYPAIAIQCPWIAQGLNLDVQTTGDVHPI